MSEAERAGNATKRNPPQAKHREFDFLQGAWLAENRRMAGSAREWVRFHSIHRCSLLRNGRGYLHEIEAEASESEVMLHLFDAAQTRWGIYSISAAGLEHPLRGNIKAGVGTFVGPATLDGRAVLLRQVWSRMATPNPEWTQSYSLDGGKSWEMNWTRRFVRADWPD